MRMLVSSARVCIRIWKLILSRMTSKATSTSALEHAGVAFNGVGWKYYVVLAICGFTNALFFWAFMPETRGIPLEELDAYFASVPLFVPGSIGDKGYDAETRERDLRESR